MITLYEKFDCKNLEELYIKTKNEDEKTKPLVSFINLVKEEEMMLKNQKKNPVQQGDVVKTALSDNSIVLATEGEDALLFDVEKNEFVVALHIQKEGEKVFWGQGRYSFELPNDPFNKKNQEHLFNNPEPSGTDIKEVKKLNNQEREDEWDLEI